MRAAVTAACGLVLAVGGVGSAEPAAGGERYIHSEQHYLGADGAAWRLALTATQPFAAYTESAQGERAALHVVVTRCLHGVCGVKMDALVRLRTSEVTLSDGRARVSTKLFGSSLLIDAAASGPERTVVVAVGTHDARGGSVANASGAASFGGVRCPLRRAEIGEGARAQLVSGQASDGSMSAPKGFLLPSHRPAGCAR